LSPKLNLSKFRKILSFDTVFFCGGYCAQSISMKDVRPPTQGPEPSAARLAPWAFSVGVVDSLGTATLKRFPKRAVDCGCRYAAAQGSARL
jgi:hypothetical protein